VTGQSEQGPDEGTGHEIAGGAGVLADDLAGILLGLAGAVLGGAAGFLLTLAAARYGLHAVILAGLGVGLGCGYLSGRRSVPLGLLCGGIALVVELVAEWRLAPFVKDKSLSYFIAHAHQLGRGTQILLVAGALIAMWFGVGRERGPRPHREPT